MELEMNGVIAYEKYNGLVIESEEPLYVLANRKGYDFKYATKFDNHYYNNPSLKRFKIEKDGILVISTVEYLEKKYFTNISLILDVKLDNLTMINLYRTVVESIASTSWMANAINKDKLDNKVGNFYNIIFIACRSEADVNISFDISLFYEVKELVNEALEKSFDNLNMDNKGGV
ncbi:hypothetical protein [Candidatus Methanosphaera massiliense]|jgi:hypothetical protein|uniref:hypothetical protein n=1 Tax=Methanosphaera TaxID=2316 RepID=UPI0023801DC5|nr:hypothetical protein [Candidatus Methanosphaera massiliense]MDD6286278.1 hypothetical protein [Methanobacteriaceae archaeon]MDE4077557.1 hypothetical protein [Candidatus Methanosphaera massiliense]MDY2744212.1 hypothetical protein [Methanosphaera sp.]